MGVRGALTQAAAGIRWYTRELMGDASYERYVQHLRATHPHAPVPSEREFWREKHAVDASSPTSRCC